VYSGKNTYYQIWLVDTRQIYSKILSKQRMGEIIKNFSNEFWQNGQKNSTAKKYLDIALKKNQFYMALEESGHAPSPEKILNL